MSKASPFRYPGGKHSLTPLLSSLIEINNLADGAYAEPFAGGAGAALALLFSEHVRSILLNDADPSIYACWAALLDQPEEFCKLIYDTAVNVDEWRKQKAIYSGVERENILELGFSTFFLNRTNRSGIIKNAGPIGGFDQSGRWKINARYNRAELIKRVQRIAMYRKRITMYGLDALKFIQTIKSTPKLFVYLDPPYYVKGCELYLNHLRHSDHENLSQYMRSSAPFAWLMSYDDVPQIRELYRNFRTAKLSTSYTATRTRKSGQEILIPAQELRLSSLWDRCPA